MHHEERTLVVREPLYRVEPLGHHGRPVGIAIAVRVFEEPHLIAPDNLRAEPRHVIDGDEQRARSRPRGDHRWILDERVAGEEGRLEPLRKLQWWEALLRLRTRGRGRIAGLREGCYEGEDAQRREKAAEESASHDGTGKKPMVGIRNKVT
jgi:hypothetical protein